MNDNKDAFDLWWEWAEKPVESMLTIDADIHEAVMALPPDERRDRAKVNEAVRDAPEERRDRRSGGRPDASMQGAGPNRCMAKNSARRLKLGLFSRRGLHRPRRLKR